MSASVPECMHIRRRRHVLCAVGCMLLWNRRRSRGVVGWSSGSVVSIVHWIDRLRCVGTS